MKKKNMPEKWQKEADAIKAVQVAFDLGEEIQAVIRREALEMGLNPSDRVREILGLPVSRRTVRPRLSISLTPDDFVQLAGDYKLNSADKVGLKREAAQVLIDYVEKNRS
ncbi:MAG: hypothetical protein JKY01_08960 [Pseudomonadales bacterium]|nr:hypothetical protein [Pseudomonadales bacterium]